MRLILIRRICFQISEGCVSEVEESLNKGVVGVIYMSIHGLCQVSDSELLTFEAYES
jgi:hypothetical protein